MAPLRARPASGAARDIGGAQSKRKLARFHAGGVNERDRDASSGKNTFDATGDPLPHLVSISSLMPLSIMARPWASIFLAQS